MTDPRTATEPEYSLDSFPRDLFPRWPWTSAIERRELELVQRAFAGGSR